MSFLPERHRTVLIVLNMQNDFCHDNGAISKLGNNIRPIQKIVPNIVDLINYAKNISIPVIYVVTNHDIITDLKHRKLKNGIDGMNFCQTGSWGAEIYALEKDKADYIVVKNRFSSFHGTNLDIILRSLERNMLLFCGVIANVCVESAIREANSLDYFPSLVTDCTAALSKEEYNSCLFNVKPRLGQLTEIKEWLNVWKIAK